MTVTEGTNIALTVSPDGEWIVFDLHGVLFRLPRDGGDAERLTDIELEPARPDYAPDGSRIAFQSYADGAYDIRTMNPDGSDVRRVTDGFWDDREPRWSPDGTRIAFSSDRGEHYDIWTVDVATGDLRQWTDDAHENFEPTWSPDGTEIAYVSDPVGEYGDPEGLEDSAVTIEAVDRDGNVRTLASADADETFHSPSWAPNGADLAYVRRRTHEDRADETDLLLSGREVTDDEDVFVFPPHWLSADELLYAADGEIRTLERDSGTTADVPFTAEFTLPDLEYEHKSHGFDERGPREVRGVLTPRLSPDGTRVAFVALNDLWVMRIGDSPRRVTNDAFYTADPAWSPDGRYVLYSSDEAGTQDLYAYDTRTETTHRVTSVDDAAVASSWSPDGSAIAFQNQDGATFTVDVTSCDESIATGEVRQVTDELYHPSRPTWSPDGTVLAMAVLERYSDRFREGTNQIMTVDVETGAEHSYHPGEEFASIATRDHDGPVWSPDGRWMAFVVESTLRVLPVSETGEPTGPSVQITDEATDAPTWSGDSQRLLYLHNGRLKRVRRDGTETEEIAVDLTYRRARPAGRTVIYAGGVWDGTGPAVHEDVTIEVVNDRIRSITPNTRPPEGPHVDASDLTVIPGLWDVHVHQTYAARSFGDRQGRLNLAYGITSTVSAGDYAYRAIEEREALEAGARVGPRFFATGEALDGSRLYSLTRAITSLEQLPLEMSRARALEYDYLKTYTRLDADGMAAVEDAAHEELGVPTGSHSFSPGLFVGQDGTTHLSGTQRLGYARTESATSQTYDDVRTLYGRGERSLHTTFFDVSHVLADEIEDDPRTQLFPPWKRTALREAVADNASSPTDPDCETVACRYATTFKSILDRGGIVLLGTDAPFDHVGVSMHGNLRPLVNYGGFSPYEALLTATRVPAEQFGVDDDLGTLESGKLADMVFVEGSPLDRIEDAMRVRMTMKNGELFTVRDLVEPFVSETRPNSTERSD